MRNIMVTVLWVSMFGLFGNAQQKNNKVNVVLFKQTDAYVTQMMDSLQIVGLNYAVLMDNKVVHQNSFGVSNAQLNVPLTLANSFPVASISKLFSATALYKLLVAKGRSVDETVAAFLPERTDLPESWRKLTVKQLLSHTSGIPDQIDYNIYLAPESEQEVIQALYDKPFSTPPGTESKYNATGFLLVRMLIEKLAQQNFEAYMQQTYFDALNLSSAKYGGFKKVIPNRVTCYHNIGNGLEMFPLNYSAPMYAGAGLNITITDLITWFQLLLQEQIITKEQLETVWTPVQLANGTNGHFGLGWEAYNLADNYKMVGHGGAGISSFRHYYNTEAAKNVTVILLTNGARDWSVSPNQINYQIASMVLEGTTD